MLLLFSAEIALIMFVSSSCNTCVVGFFVFLLLYLACLGFFFKYILHLLLFFFFCHQVGMLCTTPTDEHVSVHTFN